MLAQIGGPSVFITLAIPALNTTVWALGQLIFLAIYASGCSRYRIGGAFPWDASTTPTLILNSLLLSLFNLALSIPLAYTSSSLLISLGLDFDSPFPSPPVTAAHMAVCIAVEGVFFYISHRLLHSSMLYRHIHAVHHRWTHSLALACIATHPVEFALGNALPMVAGPTLLLLAGAPLHACTLALWSAFRLCETVATHSGYDVRWLPWNALPWGLSSAAFHDLHHSGDRRSNFSSMTEWMDELFSTASPPAKRE